jgi:lipoyl synthase
MIDSPILDNLPRVTGFQGTVASASGARTGGPRMPAWLKRPIAFSGRKAFVEDQLSQAGLHTVCAAAKCPNRGECHARGTATFLILGEICTRHCGFCGVKHGVPTPIDPGEPERLCDAAFRMGLRHVVVTSVTRDDAPDGGASVFARTVGMLRDRIPGVTVELLIPDFNGNEAALEIVIKSMPDVLGHNIETVPRLYPMVRPGASYQRSLQILAQTANRQCPSHIKTGIMVGLGEGIGEVEDTMRDLKAAGCSILTIGQYLRPSADQAPVAEFITPEIFKRLKESGRDMGFEKVIAGPYVRSSYRAEELVGF